jgi:hypothetical protein
LITYSHGREHVLDEWWNGPGRRVAAINTVLERDRPGPRLPRFPTLLSEITRELNTAKRKKAV